MTQVLPEVEARPFPAILLRRALRSDFFVLGLCVAYGLVIAPFTPGFATSANAVNLLITLLPLLLVALGQTLVLIVGGIDLSVTSVIGLSSITGALLMNHETGWLANHPMAVPAAVLLMLTIGIAVGAFNGFAVAQLKMPAFIVTLASMIGFSGLAIWVNKSNSIYGLPSGFNILGGNLLVAFVITAICVFVIHLILSSSLLGKWFYAVGHNARAAQISGIPVKSVIIAAYLASGFLAACAGILYTGQSEAGSPVMGQRILLDVIGATVIGGTSLMGGRGKVLWTCFGVLFLKLIDNSLNLLNLSIFTITMVKGGIILLAAFVGSVRQQLDGQSS